MNFVFAHLDFLASVNNICRDTQPEKQVRAGGEFVAVCLWLLSALLVPDARLGAPQKRGKVRFQLLRSPQSRRGNTGTKPEVPQRNTNADELDLGSWRK